MTRRPSLTAVSIERVRRDPRYVAALGADPTTPGWRARGACARTDPDAFFPEVMSQQTRALAVCGTCPVQGACLLTALQNAEPDGVWGATSARDRATMQAVYALAG